MLVLNMIVANTLEFYQIKSDQISFFKSEGTGSLMATEEYLKQRIFLFTDARHESVDEETAQAEQQIHLLSV